MNMKTLRHYLAVMIYAVLAGFCIGLGGTVFLKLKNAFTGGNVVGALFFSVGLFTICTRGYNLFTGKVCYLFDNEPSYIIDLITIWIGNFIGTFILAAILGITSLTGGETGIDSIAYGLVAGKMSSSYLSLFLLGIVCNIFIYIAVNGYAKNPHAAGKYLAIFLGVSCFILCGTEHCIADMFYWAVSGTLISDPFSSLLRILTVTAGNIVGAVSFPLAEKLHDKLEAPV